MTVQTITIAPGVTELRIRLEPEPEFTELPSVSEWTAADVRLLRRA